MRLTSSPEIAFVDPDRRRVDHDHPSAVAFAVVGTSVALARRGIHATIFNACKAAARPDRDLPGIRAVSGHRKPQAVFKEYGVEFFPSEPEAKDLAAFAKIENTLSARRAATLAGRAWVGVTVDSREVTLISFWVKKAQVSPSTTALIVRAVVAGDCLVEFEDSEAPETFTFKPGQRRK